MSYVAVKGGEKAILNAERLLQAERRGDIGVPELDLEQIKQQMGLAIARVMCEGSLYDRDLAALAIKQSWGDLVEAAFLLRAYRTTLPRFYYSQPLDTRLITLRRRISSIYKDLPGGQQLGPTFDYVHRLLDFTLAAKDNQPIYPHREAAEPDSDSSAPIPRAIETLDKEGLIQPEGLPCNRNFAHNNGSANHWMSKRDRPASSPTAAGAKSQSPSSQSPARAESVFDVTREPLSLPAGRDARLQNLARADEGFLLGLAYSTQRGYGHTHPFAGEIRVGQVEVLIFPEELGFEVAVAEIEITEVQMVNQFTGNQQLPPQFTRGYGLTFGYSERKAMAMALMDRALRAKEFGERLDGPAQQEEFVLYHSDNVEAQGFVQHLKLPHYIDFQAELNLVRQMRAQRPHPKP